MQQKKNTKAGTYSALTGWRRAMPITLLAVAVFCALCFITQNTGVFGRGISNVFLGLFSIGGYFIPFILALHAFFFPSDVYKRRTVSRIIFSSITLIMISTITHTITYFKSEPAFSIVEFYKNGTSSHGGGVIGGVVAWALTAIFGQVGLIIITILVFALYITYFFAGGKSMLSRLLLKILTAISDFFSGIGKKSKKGHETKQAKSNKKKIRELTEKQEELLDDEFFAADNGMKEFSIPELGIKETRSQKEVESNPVLQNKVRHKASFEGEFTVADSQPNTNNFEQEPRNEQKRRINMDYSTYDSVHDLSLSTDDSLYNKRADDIVYDAPQSKPERFGLDENAGDVFTRDFDPFDFKLNEELTNKQSSKIPKNYTREPEGINEFSEPLTEINEDEINKARQRADFEMKKKASLDAQKRYREAAEEIKRSTAETQASSSTVSESDAYERTSEPFIPDYMKEADFKSYQVPQSTPVVVDFTEEEAESIREDLKISRTMLSPNPGIEDSADQAAAPAANDTVYSAYAPAAEPLYKKEEPLEFELETDADDELIDDELNENDFDDEPIEDNFAEEEIPEEEQNEDVKEYRRMFPFLDEDDGGEEAEHPSDKIPSEIVFDDDFEEEAPEVIEDNEEVLDVPFEFTPISNPTPKSPEPQEKKEEKPKERVDYSNYVFPSLDLLARGKVEEDPDQEIEKNQNAEILVDSLLQFNVRVSIKGIDRGPRITRYEIVPARGVKVSSVINLFNDIALKLGAEGIRMEAPIPGKSAIGVEIPNKHPSTVLLRDLVESDEFIRASSKTMCCLGKDVTGNPVFADISKMPHVLVAGATGMGKSVCINAILMSILYKARPDEVKFIMIDPKKVEFNGYNGIPHLLIPVVTDVKQAAGALLWAVEQMEKRYDLLEKLEVKKIDDYNAKVRENPELGEPMPKIIIVIDELNDIMLQVRKPAEDLIMSIAQKARAAGIHLIIGTQRPSVDVITGVIKANIPTRISCKVASYNDSKTILEQAGAEKLLNNGDMLYVSAGAPKALRVQGAFVSDNEVIAIMKHIKSQAKGQIYDEQALEDINRAAQKCSKGKGSDDDFDDEDSGENTGILNDQQFLDAVDLAIRSGKISTSLIQRKISIGYGKAAKFIDYMEEMGIVSEPNGQKPRDVLLTKNEWQEMLARRSLD